MKAIILFSGGKDCCLAAIMLSKFFEVELITYHFGLLDGYKQAEQTAKKLGMPLKIEKLPREILDKAKDITIEDGFPNNGIKYIHQKALEQTTKYSKMIGDGMRRDDRVPILLLSEIRHLEDKFDVHYVQPLMGYSRRTINIFVERFFEMKYYKSEEFIGAEYEFELREAIKQEYGFEKINEIFPKGHSQTLVINVKTKSLSLRGALPRDAAISHP